MTGRLAPLLLVPLILGPASGCLHQLHQTHSRRAATEQLLLTESIERTVAALELPDVRGRAVAVETVSLAPDDAPYLQSVVERRMLEAGARVVPAELAEVVFVAQVGALGTVGRGLSFGIPSLPLPGGIASPGLSLIRVLKQRGYTSLRLVGRDAAGGLVAQTGPATEHTSSELYAFLFVVLRRNDVYPDGGFELGIE